MFMGNSKHHYSIKVDLLIIVFIKYSNYLTLLIIMWFGLVAKQIVLWLTNYNTLFGIWKCYGNTMVLSCPLC